MFTVNNEFEGISGVRNQSEQKEFMFTVNNEFEGISGVRNKKRNLCSL